MSAWLQTLGIVKQATGASFLEQRIYQLSTSPPNQPLEVIKSIGHPAKSSTFSENPR